MKRFPFLPVVLALVLMVTAWSCTPLQEAGGEYHERVAGTPNRIYVDDPYRGTVILERDPFTGRYYDVEAYRYGARRYDPYYRDGYYGSSSYPRSNGRIYRAPRQQTPRQQPQPSQEDLKQKQQNRDDARRKVLGN